MVANGENFNIYIGTYSSIGVYTIDSNGNFLNFIDLTPLAQATGNPFDATNVNNLWTFDIIVDRGSPPITPVIIMSVAPNISGINQQVEGPIYYYIQSDNEMIALGLGPGGIGQPIDTAGGIVNLDPYLFIYDVNGAILIMSPSNINLPINWAVTPTLEASTVYQGSTKIVYGSVTRGGNSSPAGLLWSLNALIRVTFVPVAIGSPAGTLPFVFDVISDQISILSSRCVIEYDGNFYWCATNRFLFYSGLVQEVENNFSINFFFDNLNFQYANKVWATKVPHFGEIWWFFPMGDSVECNHAIVYNIREHYWYDTALDRSCGIYNQTFESPIYADALPNVSFGNHYALWQHETGLDQNINGQLTAIDSYVESSDISHVAPLASIPIQQFDRWVYLYRVELDMIQIGTVNLFVNGREYARSPVVSMEYQFDPTTVKIDMREQRRLMTLKFESNQLGGYYEMGKILVDLKIGDARQ
jgi:hypothetical protein